MKLSKNQSGFGVLELVLIIVVIGVLGAIGWYVVKQQNNKSGSNSQPTSTNSSTPTNKSVTVESAVDQIGNKIVSLSSGKYKTEKLEGGATEIQISDSTKLNVSKGSSIFYRADPNDSSFDTVDTFHKDVAADIETLKTYITSELGLENVYNYESDTAGYTYKHSVYKVDGQYLELATGSENGSYVLSWAKN